MDRPADYDHILKHARDIFPSAGIEVIYHDLEEIVHIEVQGRQYTFEIGSDDNYYLFTDGMHSFQIPLMDWE